LHIKEKEKMEEKKGEKRGRKGVRGKNIENERIRGLVGKKGKQDAKSYYFFINLTEAFFQLGLERILISMKHYASLLLLTDAYCVQTMYHVTFQMYY